MSLLKQAKRVTSLAEYATIEAIADKRAVTYDSVRMYLRRNPQIETLVIGNVVLVKSSSWEENKPRAYVRSAD